MDLTKSDRLQRRTLGVLFVSVAFGRAGMSMAFAVASIIIADILSDSTWAGASTAATTVGSAFSASILASYMGRRGRRPGLAFGYLGATIGAAIALVGGQTKILVLFLAGLALVGVGQGGNNLSRYAAADLARPEARSKAISFVVFGSTIGAVGGPTLLGVMSSIADRLGLDPNVGAFGFSVVAFALAGIVLTVFLRPDPLVVSGGLAPPRATKNGKKSAGGEGVSTAEVRSGFWVGLEAIRADPRATVAAVGLVLSQVVMVMVMAMTPLHMKAHGHELGTVGWIISVHTAGMFGFAPVAGAVSDRFGRLPTIVAGGAMLVGASILTALAGKAPVELMFPGLFLLGLGWSFGIVASSALLTESVAEHSKVAAQGSADLLTSFTSGSAALASGFVFSMAGFHRLSLLAMVGAGGMVVVAFFRLRFDQMVVGSGLRSGTK